MHGYMIFSESLGQRFDSWKFISLLLIGLSTNVASAQTFNLHGSVRDTAQQKGLQNAVVVAAKLKDSLMAAYTRSDAEGNFRIDSLL
jgi:hypothetical protein